MTASPIAFSPGSVTGFFLPVFGPTKEETVSRGLSFCLDRGVTASMRLAHSHQVVLNGKPIDIAPVQQILDELAPEPVAADSRNAATAGMRVRCQRGRHAWNGLRAQPAVRSGLVGPSNWRCWLMQRKSAT